MYILFEQSIHPKFTQSLATVYKRKRSALVHVKETEAMLNRNNASYIWRLHDGDGFCDGSKNFEAEKASYVLPDSNTVFGGIISI